MPDGAAVARQPAEGSRSTSFDLEIPVDLAESEPMTALEYCAG